jgi:ornithine decarboxylase
MLRDLAPDEPLTCVWPERIAASARRFLEGFPGWVAYAVKANPEPAVLAALHAAGVRCFDVASEAEVAQVRGAFPDAELFFHNPVKARRVLQVAHRRHGVRRYVVDHAAELAKVLEETGGGGGGERTVLVRLAVSGGAVAQDFSTKFGASPQEAAAVLRAAADAGVATGLAFHLGTQCADPDAYRRALALCGEVLSSAGVAPACLSVGGGFPAHYHGLRLPPLEEYLRAIREAAAALRLEGCALMCEPGRALVADGCSVVTRVRLRRGDLLYLGDGPTGSFGDLWYQARAAPVRLHRLEGAASAELGDFRAQGPLAIECDDSLPVRLRLPADVREGDWIEVGELGAYGAGMAMDLQRYHAVPCVTIAGEPAWGTDAAAA